MSGSEEEIAEAAQRVISWVDRTRPSYRDTPLMFYSQAAEVARAYLALISQSHTAKERAWEEAAKVADEVASEADADARQSWYSEKYGAECAKDAASKIADRIRSLISSPRREARKE